jgi:hypothetical protein
MTAAFVHLFAIWLIAGAVPQKPAGTRVIASSMDWAITAQEFEDILKTLPADGRLRFSVPANRRDLVTELVRIWVVSTEARQRGIAIGTDYKARKDYYVEYARQIGSTINNEAVQKYYQANIDDFTQVGFAHILILNGNSPITPNNEKRLPYAEAEKKAREIRAMLQNGANFEELSKKYSQDLVVGPKGGFFGYISKGLVEKSIETAAFALKPGEISDVVGSVFGFHILRVRDRKVTPLQEVQDKIRQKLTLDEVNRQLEAKVKAAGVTIDPSFFRP